MFLNASLSSLAIQLRDTAAQNKLWQSGSTLLVAVSGGVDSVALLHLLHELEQRDSLKLVVAHINHQLRGEQANADEQFVRALALKHGLDIVITRLNLRTESGEPIANRQAIARQMRYAFLMEQAKTWNAEGIVLAHHRDDQVETIVMNLMRGSGLDGVSGMSAVRVQEGVKLIRPLLAMDKQVLIDYCLDRKLAFRQDESNESNDYLRNYIRHEILPQLQQRQPQLNSAIERFAAIVREDQLALEELAKQHCQQVSTMKEDRISVDCARLAALPVALQRRVIKLLLDYVSSSSGAVEFRVDFEKVEAIRSLFCSSQKSDSQFDLHLQWVVMRSGTDGYIINRSHKLQRSRQSQGELGSITIERATVIAGAQWHFGEQWTFATNQSPDNWQTAEGFIADADQLNWPLEIRTRRPGDRIALFGMKSGTKKIQDLFVDLKVSKNVRDSYPLVTDSVGNIVWVPGLRRSSLAPVTEHSMSMIHIKSFHHL